jgi:DNA-binding NarL/FixJ family response regulator
MFENELRIVVADSNSIFKIGLRKVLSEMEDFKCNIVQEVQSAKELLEMTISPAGCILLLDMNLPDMDGIEVLSKLKENYGEIRTIVLSSFDEPNVVKAAFKAGAEGYIMKNAAISEYFSAIKSVANGQSYLGKNLTLINGAGTHSRFLNQERLNISYEDRFLKKFNLTRREMEIMKLIGNAMSNKEIAKELYISEQTACVHRKNIMRKLGVSSSANIVKMVHEFNLI